MIDENRPFLPVGIAVLTISDTRTLETDKSGKTLVDRAGAAGHTIAAHKIVKDEIDAIRAQVSTWVEDEDIQVIITTGGTGLTGRDITPEALEPMFDKHIPGFGELFRMLSYDLIGTSTIQSRTTAGMTDGTLIFALPGSTGACKDGWDKILATQLDNRFRPCNFVEMMPRYRES